MNIFDNVYILNVDPFTLYTAIFINDTLQIKNEVDLDLSLYSPFRWNYENEALYILYNYNLHKFDLFPGDTTFINKRLLITGNFSIDFTHLLSSKIENNCLILYDIENEETLKSIALDSINYSSSYRPLIDYPYVYIHHITKYSSIDIPGIRLSQYHLYQNFPNPFNPSTKISYSIPQSDFVSLKIYNTLGQEIQTLVNKSQVAGKYTISFDAQNLSSGIYFYKLQVGRNFVQKKKMILMH